MYKTEFLAAFKNVVDQKKIDYDTINNILREAIIKAFFKEDSDAKVEVVIDINNGKLEIFRLKKVIDEETELFDEFNEILLKTVKEKNLDLEVGDYFKENIDISKIDRKMVTYIQQFFMQKLTEVVNKSIVKDWLPMLHTLILAEVEKIDEHSQAAIVNLGKTNGFVSKKNQIPNEKLLPGHRYKFMIESIKEQSKGWPIILSRTSPFLVEYELRNQIPEIAEDLIKIEKIVRIPGFKSKVAVSCDDENIDPIGACLGVDGQRIKNISYELNNEKIDIVLWNDDSKKLIINALAPIKVFGIEIIEDSEKDKSLTIIIHEDDLPNVIGRSGNNIRLLSQLSGWNIDVMSLNDAKRQNIDYIDYSDYIPEGIMSFRSNYGENRNEKNNFEKEDNAPRMFTTIIKHDDDIEIDVTQSIPIKSLKNISASEKFDEESKNEMETMYKKENLSKLKKQHNAKHKSKVSLEDLTINDLFDEEEE